MQGSLKIEERGRGVRVREIFEDAACFEDKRRDVESRNAGGLQNLEKARKQILP